MSNNFGDFIKEKRIRCDYSLKYVAEIIGISNVYQSSIEAGKRPAPSYDLADYINQNDFIHKTLRFSLKNKIPESEWVRFFNAMNEKYQ